jgi:hypothetical protein
LQSKETKKNLEVGDSIVAMNDQAKMTSKAMELVNTTTAYKQEVEAKRLQAEIDRIYKTNRGIDIENKIRERRLIAGDFFGKFFPGSFVDFYKSLTNGRNADRPGLGGSW